MKKLGIFISFILSLLWASVYWLGAQNRWQTDWLASAHLNRPWVYRQLVPILVRSIPIPTDISTTIIASLFGVGFYLVLCKLLKDDTVSIFFFLIGIALFAWRRVPYDLPTAFFFTLSYYWIMNKDDRFLWIFPLAVLNRETSFLLIIFYLIYNGFSKKTLYICFVFGIIQGVLHLVFAGNQGDVAVFGWQQNIKDFVSDPSRLLIHIFIFTLVLWAVLYSWESHDQKLKIAFSCLGTISILMYLVMGQAFEVRVLWEIYPLACVLSIPTLKEIYHEMQSYQKNRLLNQSEG